MKPWARTRPAFGRPSRVRPQPTCAGFPPAASGARDLAPCHRSRGTSAPTSAAAHSQEWLCHVRPLAVPPTPPRVVISGFKDERE